MKLKLFLLFLFFSFFGVLYNINQTNHEYYSVLFEEKMERIVYGSSAPRGRILDRNGVVLADNETTTSLVLIPNQITDKETATEKAHLKLGEPTSIT